MNKNITICAALALAATQTVWADEQLHKDITVEREIVPELRAASRLNLFPRTLTFKQGTSSLQASNYLETGEIQSMISPLEPANTLAAAPLTPYRGYLDLGYFPIFRAAASAGYAIVQNENTRLNVWGQFTREDNDLKPESYTKDSECMWQLLGQVGVNFSQRFKAGVLSASTDYAFNAFKRTNPLICKALIDYSIYDDGTEKQNVNRWNIKADWDGDAGNNLKYNLGVGAGLMNFSRGYKLYSAAFDDPIELKAVHELDYTFDLGVSQSFGSSAVGLGFEGEFTHYNHFRSEACEEEATEAQDAVFLNPKGKTIGIVGVEPNYRYSAGMIDVKVGANVEFTINSGTVVHVAPDVKFNINPTSGFGAWLRFGGGERINSLRRLFEVSPYISPIYTYGTSGLPITGDLGLRFGPMKGASLGVSISYAKADEWLMPLMTGNRELMFSEQNLSAWKAKVELNWAYRSLLALRVTYEAALGDGEKETWYEWSDRARHCLEASLTVNPIERLSFDVNYTLRARRSMPFDYPNALQWVVKGRSGNAIGDILGDYDYYQDGDIHTIDLKNASLLSVGATYRINDPFSVFVRGENLLNNRSQTVALMPRTGITGLVGFTYKF
jgi:hypothetical protein